MSASSSTLSFQSPLARMRGGFRDALVLALVAAATTWVALLSWKGFAIDYSGFMGPLIIIGVVVAVSGAVLRWLRVPGALLVLAQLVIVQPDNELMQVCAELRSRCELAGHPLGQKVHEADRWIASTAIALDTPLVSDDTVFRDVPGLTVLSRPT